MSTVHTWTLWQRLPPRYQLTSRVVEEDEIIELATDRSHVIQSHSNSNSRPTSGIGSISPRQPTQPPVVQERDNFMLDSNVPGPVQVQMSSSIQKIPQARSFPNRKSEYINHFQTQKRVNSARRRLAEAPPSPTVPSGPTEPDTSRSNTAPIYPVTNPGAHSERKPRMSESSITTKKHTTPNPGNQKPRVQREPTKVNVFQFDDSKSMSNPPISYKQEQDSKPKKYVIQDTKRATMYIDNGKVIYFGKSRHDLTALLKTQSLRGDRGNCFLADLRRDYLKHPKYEGRLGRRNEADPKRIASERVDYNRKVEHILNYYSEDTEGARSRPSSAYRAVTPRGSRRKGLVLAASAPSRPPSRTESPSPDRPESPGAFIRFNKQSKLHERQFYLRTPGIKHEKTLSELEKCRCSVCRIELQLALVTGMSNTLGLTSSAQKNSDTKHTNHTTKNCNNKVVADGEQETATEPNTKEKTANGQRVTFKQPEQVSPRVQDNTLMISCTLPEMEEMTVSESGIESARTRDVESTLPDDETIGDTSVA